MRNKKFKYKCDEINVKYYILLIYKLEKNLCFVKIEVYEVGIKAAYNDTTLKLCLVCH